MTATTAGRRPADRPRPSTATASSSRSWVLVVGMHRSGTSAVTGAIGALGGLLPGPDDHLSGPGNPEHYESRALTYLNERLLVAMGGSWEGPPPFRPHWPQSAAVLLGDRVGAALHRAFPQDARLVWKDPRLCLLLPFWRRVLTGPVAAVLVWRPPLAVARSLAHRDGMPVADGLALWERYNRAALSGLRGLPTTVVEYDAVVVDPAAFADDMAGWLEGLDGFPRSPIPGDRTAATTLIQQGLRHESSEASGQDPFFTDQQRALAELLGGLDGHHRTFGAPALGAESPLTDALLSHRRRAAGLRNRLESSAEQRDAARIRHFEDRTRRFEERRRHGQAAAKAAQEIGELESELDATREHLAAAQLALDNLHQSSSWRLTAPVRWSLAQAHKRGRPTSPPKPPGSA